MALPFVSIIIPTWRESTILQRCLDALVQLDYPRDKYEVLLVSRDELRAYSNSIRSLHIEKGVNYAHARNIGVREARGELIAFIDDDSIAPRNWLRKSVEYFNDSEVALVGGPAVPLQKDSVRYRVGGYLFTSPLVVGAVSSRYRILPSRAFKTAGEHLIMANNILRKDAFLSVGGLHRDQAPCEDGYLYFRLHTAGHKLLYAPDLFVWHRAKPVFLPILSKIFYYAMGRGGLMARDPRTIRPMYLVPTFFVEALVVLGAASFFSRYALLLLAGLIAVYGVFNILNALYIFLKFERNPLVALLVFLATPLVHISYGAGVLYGVYRYLAGGFIGGVPMWSKD